MKASAVEKIFSQILWQIRWQRIQPWVTKVFETSFGHSQTILSDGDNCLKALV